MSINYEELLTNEQKKNILSQRIAQFASEAWQHSLNKQTCELIGDEEGAASADKALTIINAAIQVHQEKLSELEE